MKLKELMEVFAASDLVVELLRTKHVIFDGRKALGAEERYELWRYEDYFVENCTARSDGLGSYVRVVIS